MSQERSPFTLSLNRSWRATVFGYRPYWNSVVISTRFRQLGNNPTWSLRQGHVCWEVAHLEAVLMRARYHRFRLTIETPITVPPTLNLSGNLMSLVSAAVDTSPQWTSWNLHGVDHLQPWTIHSFDLRNLKEASLFRIPEGLSNALCKSAEVLELLRILPHDVDEENPYPTFHSLLHPASWCNISVLDMLPRWPALAKLPVFVDRPFNDFLRLFENLRIFSSALHVDFHQNSEKRPHPHTSLQHQTISLQSDNPSSELRWRLEPFISSHLTSLTLVRFQASVEDRGVVFIPSLQHISVWDCAPKRHSDFFPTIRSLKVFAPFEVDSLEIHLQSDVNRKRLAQDATLEGALEDVWGGEWGSRSLSPRKLSVFTSKFCGPRFPRIENVLRYFPRIAHYETDCFIDSQTLISSLEVNGALKGLFSNIRVLEYVFDDFCLPISPQTRNDVKIVLETLLPGVTVLLRDRDKGDLRFPRLNSPACLLLPLSDDQP